MKPNGTCSRRFLSAILFAGTCGWGQQVSSKIDESRRVTIALNTPLLARPEFDRGKAPDDLPLRRMILVLKLGPGKDAELASFLDRLHDRSSPDYHRWLTPAEFGARFGISQTGVQRVSEWLTENGFRVENVANGRSVIEFSGTAAQVGRTFGTEIHRYEINGEKHWSNSSDPSIPAELAEVVSGIASLNDFRARPLGIPGNRVIEARAIPGTKPEFISIQSRQYLAPADLAAIYNVAPLYQAGVYGQGRTVAVVGRSNFDPRDVADFRARFNLPPNMLQVIVNGEDPGNLGGDDEGEAVFDATWAGALAPYATVKFVVSAGTYATDPLDLSEEYIIDNNVADVITESFIFCEDLVAKSQTLKSLLSILREQAAAQGITFAVASGDGGAYSCDDHHTEMQVTPPSSVESVNARASSPYVVAVGGTQFAETANDPTYWNTTNTGNSPGSAKGYIPEAVWNQTCDETPCFSSIEASGGGHSTFYPLPPWQALLLPPGASGRRVPDVAFSASNHHDPYLFCLHRSCQLSANNTFQFQDFGGTSASAPVFASMMALIDQTANARQGQVNQVLYPLAQTDIQSGSCNASNSPAATCLFHDITSGTSAVPGGTSDYAATPGYDMATGLGSVNLANLAAKWPGLSLSAVTVQLSLSPATLVHGTSVSVNVTVSSKNGTPTGDVALLSGSGMTLGAFTLASGAVAASLSSLPGGMYTVTAHYNGDARFAPADSAPFPVTVSAESSQTTARVLNLGTSSTPYGTPLMLNASVAGASGASSGVATGIVSFLDGGAPLSGNPYPLITDSNIRTPAIGTFAVGAHSITASYGGDASFRPSVSPPVSFTIAKAPTSTAVTASGGCPASGAAITLSATVNAGGSTGIPPSGTLTFLAGGQTLGAPVTLTGGVQNGAAIATASMRVAALPSSQATFTVHYSGDANYQASAPDNGAVVTPGGGLCIASAVNAGSGASAVAPDAYVSIYGASLATTTASASGDALQPSLGGVTVQFTDSSGTKAPALLSYASSGQVNALVPSNLKPGIGSIAATNSAGTTQYPIQIQTIAPALFTVRVGTSNIAAALITRVKQDGSQSVEPVVTADTQGNLAAAPIVFNPGDQLFLELYGTGLRHVASPSTSTVSLGSGTMPVLYLGPQTQYAGLDQVNVALPPSLAGQGSVTITVDVDNGSSTLISTNAATVVFK
jgi:uncharacterized protein (TIGR03437 family)